MTEEQASEVEAIINALNPGAEIIATTLSKVPLDRVLDTKLFDYDKAESSAGWIRNSKESTPQKPKNTIRVSRIVKAVLDARKFADTIADRENFGGVFTKGFGGSDHRVAYQFAQAVS